MAKNINYQNKYFSILGDSISTFEGISAPKNAAYYNHTHKMKSGVVTVLDTWWGQVIERLGGELLVNHSWSGSTVCRYSSCEVPSYACGDERTSALSKDGIQPDVIMVFMGTNDWGWGFRINDNTNAKDSENNCALFSVAYRTMLSKLKKNYPNAEIWCITLSTWRCSIVENFEFSYHPAGRHMSEYCEAIRTCAEELDCRVIDLYHANQPYEIEEGAHPNVEGMRTIADVIWNELQKE